MLHGIGGLVGAAKYFLAKMFAIVGIHRKQKAFYLRPMGWVAEMSVFPRQPEIPCANYPNKLEHVLDVDQRLVLMDSCHG